MTRFDTHIDYVYLSSAAQEIWKCEEVNRGNLMSIRKQCCRCSTIPPRPRTTSQSLWNSSSKKMTKVEIWSGLFTSVPIIIITITIFNPKNSKAHWLVRGNTCGWDEEASVRTCRRAKIFGTCGSLHGHDHCHRLYLNLLIIITKINSFIGSSQWSSWDHTDTHGSSRWPNDSAFPTLEQEISFC